MKKIVQLKYDELNTIVKRMRDEGEDMTTLARLTREKVHDLYLEWIGEGAEKFFDEMDTKLLPALSRLAHAFFATQTALTRIIKVMKDADHETARYFKGDLARMGLSGTAGFGSDFSEFASNLKPHLDLGVGPIGQVIGTSSGIGGSVASQNDDLAQQVGQQESSSGSDNPRSGNDTSGGSGGGDSGGAGSGGGSSSEAGSGGSSAGTAGVGGSQGISFGSGVGTGPGAIGNNSSGGGGMPDHLYQGAGSSGSGSGIGNPSTGTAGSEDQVQSGGVGVAAAGAAGAAGAAVGAVKAVRGRKK